MWVVSGPQSGSSLLSLVHVLIDEPTSLQFDARYMYTVHANESTKLPLFVLHYKFHCFEGGLRLELLHALLQKKSVFEVNIKSYLFNTLILCPGGKKNKTYLNLELGLRIIVHFSLNGITALRVKSSMERISGLRTFFFFFFK